MARKMQNGGITRVKWNTEKTVLDVNYSEIPLSGEHREQEQAGLLGTHVFDDLVDFSKVVEEPPPAFAWLMNDEDRGVPRAF